MSRHVWSWGLGMLMLVLGMGNLGIMASPPLSTAVVERVVDGDTLRVIMDGQRELVRLIGVDTPESKPNEKAIRDARRQGIPLKAVIRSGIVATQFTQQQVKPGDTIRLAYDKQERDRYHRLLAYVYTDNGKMLNATLLEHGMATPMPIAPNTRYRAWFASLHKP